MIIDGVSCKLWTGSLTKRGYGRGWRKGVEYAAHRDAWERERGAIPPETPCVLHRCDVPACYEVRHLFLGTKSDNHRDMIAKRRQNNQNKTHCIRQHPLSGRNLRVGRNGSRYCRKCAAMRERARRQRIKANA